MDIIIYGSLHGSARRYAERLSEITGFDSVSFKEVKNVDCFNRIIYIGAIYAGGILGLKKILSRISLNQKILVATVGVTDPDDAEFVGNMKALLKTLLPPDLYDESRIFHLQGAIDYNKLGVIHRILMSMLHSKTAKMPKEKLNAESRALVETYGKKVDFIDFDKLNPIVRAIEMS